MLPKELFENILVAKEELLNNSIEANTVVLNGKKFAKFIPKVPGYKPTIFGMDIYCEENDMPFNSDFMVQYNPPKHKTNSECIRTMSDTDLAALLSGGEPYPWCEQDPCPAETCQECILMWLKQETKTE